MVKSPNKSKANILTNRKVNNKNHFIQKLTFWRRTGQFYHRK